MVRLRPHGERAGNSGADGAVPAHAWRARRARRANRASTMGSAELMLGVPGELEPWAADDLIDLCDLALTRKERDRRARDEAQ